MKLFAFSMILTALGSRAQADLGVVCNGTGRFKTMVEQKTYAFPDNQEDDRPIYFDESTILILRAAAPEPGKSRPFSITVIDFDRDGVPTLHTAGGGIAEGVSFIEMDENFANVAGIECRIAAASQDSQQ